MIKLGYEGDGFGMVVEHPDGEMKIFGWIRDQRCSVGGKVVSDRVLVDASAFWAR